jgi:hypothetical protein
MKNLEKKDNKNMHWRKESSIENRAGKRDKTSGKRGTSSFSLSEGEEIDFMLFNTDEEDCESDGQRLCRRHYFSGDEKGRKMGALQ